MVGARFYFILFFCGGGVILNLVNIINPTVLGFGFFFYLSYKFCTFFK